jgi:hypothetical protein
LRYTKVEHTANRAVVRSRFGRSMMRVTGGASEATDQQLETQYLPTHSATPEARPAVRAIELARHACRNKIPHRVTLVPIQPFATQKRGAAAGARRSPWRRESTNAPDAKITSRTSFSTPSAAPGMQMINPESPL